MNYIVAPSLLHLISVKIASHFLKDSDIVKILNRNRDLPINYNCFDREVYELWTSIENIVIGKLPHLPPNLPKKVAKLIRPMYLAIKAWITDNDLPYENEHFSYYINLIYWNTDGTIDGEQTAHQFLQSGYINFRERFVIACNYCFEDEILSLWNEKKWKFKLFGTNEVTGKPTNAAIRLWIDRLKGGNAKPIAEIIEEYFQIQYISTLDIPLKLSSYFSHLPHITRSNILFHCIHHNNDFRLCFFQMDDLERMEILNSKPTSVLAKCLAWPYDSLFMKLVNEVKSHLTVIHFRRILAFIILVFILRGWDYFEIFRDFWNIIPVSYQDEIKEIKNEFMAYKSILNYNEIGESQNILKKVEMYFPFTIFYLDYNQERRLQFHCPGSNI